MLTVRVLVLSLHRRSPIGGFSPVSTSSLMRPIAEPPLQFPRDAAVVPAGMLVADSLARDRKAEVSQAAGETHALLPRDAPEYLPSQRCIYRRHTPSLPRTYPRRQSNAS